MKYVTRRSNEVPTAASRCPTSSLMSQTSVMAAGPSSLCRLKEITGEVCGAGRQSLLRRTPNDHSPSRQGSQ
jgi:hypothetical protein